MSWNKVEIIDILNIVMDTPNTSDKTQKLKELLLRARDLVVRKRNLLINYRKRREGARIKELREKLGTHQDPYEDS